MPLGPMELVFCTHRTPFYCWDFLSIYCIRLVCTLSLSLSLLLASMPLHHLEFLNATYCNIQCHRQHPPRPPQQPRATTTALCSINIFESFSTVLMEATKHLKFISRINVNVYKKVFSSFDNGLI